MATAKQVHYNPPLALLPKRKPTTLERRTAVAGTTAAAAGTGVSLHRPTLTVTIPFPFHTQRLTNRTRRPSATPSIRRSTSTSLPRLVQPSARPSEATTTTTTTTTTNVTDSAAKKLGPGEGSNHSATPATEDVVPCTPAEDPAEAEEEEEEELSPEEVEEMRVTNEKCLKWLAGLPSKFSGMHMVQTSVYGDNR